MSASRTIATVFALALIAAACGSGETVADSADDAAATTTAEETTTTAEPVAVDETETAEEGTESAADLNGQELYEARCASCHGADGVGTRGPDLVGIAETQPDTQVAIDQVINGGNGMPAFGARLSAEEIEATVDYIYATF